MKRRIEKSVSDNMNSIQLLIEILGLELRFGHNLQEFSEIIQRQPLRHKPAPAFRPGSGLGPEIDVLWMACHDYNDELVCTQAIKLINLENQNLFEYLGSHMWDIHPYGFDPEVSEVQYFLSDQAQAISGRITYHGELWLKGGPNGVRGGSLATLVTRLILLKALSLWSPDYMIGLQTPSLACKGLGVRESYMRMEQRSVLWGKRRQDELLEGWLVWMSAREAEFNLRVPAEIFFEMFEEKDAVKPVLTKVA